MASSVGMVLNSYPVVALVHVGGDGTSSFSYQLLSDGGTFRGLALPMYVFIGTIDGDECGRTVDVPGVHVDAVV